MLQGKTALITGANRGIGRAILRLFAKNGARIFANSRTHGSLDREAEELGKDCNVEITPMYFDVSRPDEVKDAFQKILKHTKTLDILVNNAGVLENNLLGMLGVNTIREVFEINAFGTIYMMQYASRIMMRSKSGSIINLSSIVGVNGSEGQVAYSGSKAAVIGITRSAAKELAKYNIRVNAVAPGFIDTDMVRTLSEAKFKERMDSIGMGRMGTPAEVADCVLFLALDNSRYITGQIIGVDGGMLI